MKRRRQLARGAMIALTVALIGAWVILLRPQILGGPVAYVIVSGESMKPTFANGDLVLAKKKSSYRVGDVVAYRVPKGDPGAGALVIHRLVGGSARVGYLTKGDNREGRDLWRPRPSDTLGSVYFRAPRAGLVLVFMRTPLGLAVLAGLATFLFVHAGGGENGPSTVRLRETSNHPRKRNGRASIPA
jgi:signal peptidase I